MKKFDPKLHVVELSDLGFRYYRGCFESLDEVPPRYTWRRVDFRGDDTVVYVDMQGSDI